MRKVLLPAVAVVALGVGGFGVAQLASADPASTPTTSTSTAGSPEVGPHGGHHRGGHGPRLDVASLASKLGVDESKLKTALDEARDTLRPTAEERNNGTRPDRTAMQDKLADSLAKSLGLDKAKVTEALQSLDSERQAEAKAELKTRLDQAVKDGKLSQADADSVAKAADAGIIGPGSHR